MDTALSGRGVRAIVRSNLEAGTDSSLGSTHICGQGDPVDISRTRVRAGTDTPRRQSIRPRRRPSDIDVLAVARSIPVATFLQRPGTRRSTPRPRRAASRTAAARASRRRSESRSASACRIAPGTTTRASSGSRDPRSAPDREPRDRVTATRRPTTRIAASRLRGPKPKAPSTTPESAPPTAAHSPITRSEAPCTAGRASTGTLSLSSVEPATRQHDQPRPRRNSPTPSWADACDGARPATTADSSSRTAPATMMRTRPAASTSHPTTGENAYMPATWTLMTRPMTRSCAPP